MTLTYSQLSAVEAADPVVLLIAAAGAGKTRTLVERIAYLLEHGAKVEDMLVLTFTRRAADEMRERLAKRLGWEKVPPDLWMGTFHSLALRVLRTYADKVGYWTDRNLSVLTPDEADMVLRLACEKLFGEGQTKGLMGKLCRYREDQYTGRKRTAEKEKVEAQLKLAFGEYLDMMRVYHVVDFGSILQGTRRLFAEHPEVLATFHARFKHVLVDELQDTDTVQYDLHEFFAPPASFFGVGDPRQAVYTWRGARPDLIKERYVGRARIIDLAECFRCGSEIVAVANNLIAHDPDNIAAPMVSATGRNGVVRCVTTQRIDEHAQDYAQVVQQVRTLLDSGYSPGDIAILGRRHRDVEGGLLSALLAEALPVQVVGARESMAKSEAFHELHMALRLAVNPDDSIAFLTLRHRLLPGGVTLNEVGACARAGEMSAFEACRQIGEKPLSAIIGQVGEQKIGEAVPVLSEVLLGHGVSFAGEDDWWVKAFGGRPIAEALDAYAAMQINEGEDYREADAITLSTIHAAKGLEWPAVVVVGLNEGVLPGKLAIKADDVREERRVLYVALTRAREVLVLHWCASDEPSRFLAEAGIATDSPLVQADRVQQTVPAAWTF